jgi:hypothetical protein
LHSLPCVSYLFSNCAYLLSRHFSYPSHNRQYGIPLRIVSGAYFYSGRHSSEEYTYQNTGTGHRVSNYWDKDGDTFCTKQVSGLQVQ